MSQSFNQQAYQFHTVYQPENFCNAQQWYGQPEQPFVAAEQYELPNNNNNDNNNTPRRDEAEDDEDDEADNKQRDGDPSYAAALAQAAGVAAAASHTHDNSDDSSENEDDDPATRIAKQLLRKRPSTNSNKKKPPRHDFKKSQVRVRIQEAKTKFENATHAVKEAERAYENAQRLLEQREMEWNQVNEEMVDELLEAEKIRPWNKVYFQLAEYKKQHGHIALTGRATTNKRRREEPGTAEETQAEFLGGWIMRQRSDRNRGKLEEWKVLALNRLGFVWDGLESMWHSSYQKVKEYYDQHGHINITAKEDMPLNRWLKTQRHTYKEYKNSGFVEPGKNGCKMNRERKELLDALGMDWGDEDLDDNWWIEPFNRLREIRFKQGHLRSLPKDETVLLNFVKRQRQAYEKYLAHGCRDSFEMSAERVSLLNEIGFPWTGSMKPFVEEAGKGRGRKRKQESEDASDMVVISYYNPWMTQFNRVKEFVQKYGHFRYSNEEAEPKQKVEQMAKWDATQRKFKDYSGRKKYLTPERLELLNSIRFFQSEDEWDFSFRLAELRKFRRRHGHCMILSSYPETAKYYQELADWATNIRKEYKKLQDGLTAKITMHEVDTLNMLGFNWNVDPSPAAAMPAVEGILAIANAPPKQSAGSKPPEQPSARPQQASSIAESGAKESTMTTKDNPPEEEEPAKRKRGRPKKNAQDL